MPSPPGLACLARTSGAGAEQRSHLLSHLHDSFLPPTSPVSSLTRRPPTPKHLAPNGVVSSPVRRRHCSAFLEYHRGHKVPLLQQSRPLHSLAGPPSLLDDLTPNPNEPRLRKDPPERSPPSSCPIQSRSQTLPANITSPRSTRPGPALYPRQIHRVPGHPRPPVAVRVAACSLYHHYRESETLFGL